MPDRPAYRTRVGGYLATLNHIRPWGFQRSIYLGTITINPDWIFGWAWHLDGSSIDTEDNGFDLVDFPQAEAFLETVAADG
jgi:hypothetical protein